MYSQDLESKVLKLARERGLLAEASSGDLDPAPLMDLAALSRSSCFGPRLDRLLDKGLLGRKAVEGLVWELILGNAPADSIPAPEGAQLPELEGGLAGRFEELELIGEGATAQVYKAFDPRLQRWVALKFLKTVDSGHREVLLEEARAQAKVEHPNVCRVHEVGQIEGRGYILMEFARGGTLTHLIGRLDEREKLRLLRDVAEGVHAAHRQGLVHLDLKPGNILIQPSGDGSYRPLITDFGMVVSEDQARVGMPSPMGTPPYSSPEQIAGRREQLDRRSDIYSLGVLLYALLCGRLPFEAEDFQGLIDAIQHKAPVPLRRRDPKASPDLEAIIATCMEKDPLRRYPSALALADDLERYRSGEPVQAQRQSRAYLLRMWIRRNRVLAAVLAAATLVCCALVALGAGLIYRVKTQARLARSFQEEADRMETVLRDAHDMPFHDITPEMALVRKRMEAVRADMQREGALAKGPGLYALGRAQLMLGDPEQAQQYLQQAWDAGFRAPEEALAMGEALGRIHQLKLIEYTSLRPFVSAGDPFGSGELPAATSRQLKEAYGTPSRAFLALGDPALSPERRLYLEGLDDLQEQPEAAVDCARRMQALTPWDPEAWVLESMGERALASRALAGRRFDEAGRILERMEAALLRARDLARSSPEVFEAETQRRYLVLRMKTLQILATEQDLEWALDATRLNLQVDPGSWRARTAQASLRLLWQNQIETQGRDTRPVLRKASEDCEAALQLNPRSGWALSTEGGALFLLGYIEFRLHGNNDPRPIRRALELYQRALELTPFKDVALCNMGTCHSFLGINEVCTGDPRAPEDLDASVRAFQASAALAPLSDTYYQLGTPFKWRGRRRAWMGQDPVPDYEQALEALWNSLRLAPVAPYTEGHIADMHLLLAEWRLQQGQDPGADITEAVARSRHCIQLADQAYLGHINLAEGMILKARWGTPRGEDPGPALDEAQRELTAADARHVGDPEITCDFGALAREKLRWALVRGGDIETPLAEGLAAAERAFSLSGQRHAYSRAMKAQLLLLAAQRPGPKAEARRREALADLELAARLNPGLAWEVQRLARDQR